MALPSSVQFAATPQSPALSACGHLTFTSVRLKSTPTTVIRNFLARPPPTPISTKPRRRKQAVFAVEENLGNSESDSASREPEPESQPQPAETKVEVSEVGSEIKKALEEREGDLLSGVAEEVREIEWPAFGKVLGTTWVVIGVIAGSSVVLLTVNAVLAELSDRIFAGRGFQDFFG